MFFTQFSPSFRFLMFCGGPPSLMCVKSPFTFPGLAIGWRVTSNRSTLNSQSYLLANVYCLFGNGLSFVMFIIVYFINVI